VLVLFLAVGCGDRSVARVSGRVTLNGEPLAGAAVVFQPVPVPGSSNPGRGSAGVTDAEGRYTLKLVGTEKEGAVLGKHKVRIVMMEEPDSSDDEPRKVKPLPPKYNRETTLEYEVIAGSTDAADFALTAP
jgi:hypothetical protein